MKKYAVIGNPIGHSLSPAMHNAAFKAIGADATYEAVEVKNICKGYDSLKQDYEGISVTIPHKVDILEYIDEKDRTVELIGATNCISFGNKAKAYNTDIGGAVDALKTEVPELEGKSVLVLGAGGAARAIVYGCALEGAEISIYNRTDKRARSLADDVKDRLGIKVLVQEKCNLKGFDVLINATSVGMHPNEGKSPIGLEIPGGIVVMDIVYNPLETELLRLAKKAGARTINGVEMFVRQGAEALRIWGYEPQVGVMRDAVLNELNGG